MINVAAIRMQQFGVQFYQASLTASDIDKLVRFEVLNYGESGQAGGPRRQVEERRSAVESELGPARAAHRVEREGVSAPDHPPQDRRARPVLRAVPPGARPAVDSRRGHHLLRREAAFQPMDGDSRVGILKVPEREGILRAIDGQHRLLALHADIDRFQDEDFTVPAIIFDRLPEDHVVQMFVTINAKHTRLNASHLVSLSGRQLYRDEALATAHDVVRALNDREDSPLYDEIKLLGVGRGRVAQAPLAQELKKLFAADGVRPGAQDRPTSTRRRRSSSSTTSSRSRSCSAARGTAASTASSRRRRCAPSCASRPTSSAGSIRSTPIAPTSAPSAASIAPWGRRIGDLRFETEGAWKRGGTTVDSLAKELRLALQYPEGAAV